MRLKIHITGAVQGVGFRPFVYRLAEEAGLRGYVLNDTNGVLIEVEGEKQELDRFLIRIDIEKPEISKIYGMQHSFLEEAGYKDFKIRESEGQGERRVSILPDIAICDECSKEIDDPDNRRFEYPFTNCTNCGPRFTIIEEIPYDRQNTSMKNFNMCPECWTEYSHVLDRRFHAQPDACHSCGPWVSLYDAKGNSMFDKEGAIERAVDLIKEGDIVAVKGIGGYHLICDAMNEDAVVRLRKRKQREEKPMAVMFPDMEGIKAAAIINDLEERAINSVERPIVIVQKKEGNSIARSVSEGNSTLGVFLPYTPLHRILLSKLKGPVIATSANMTDEPIASHEKDAFSRLEGIADGFLAHNREIFRRCDDSVVRIIAERQVPVRRSRGFAPLPVILPFKLKVPVLALGSYMNNTIAVGIDDKVYLSQHIGDLDTPLAVDFYEETIDDFLRLFDIKPGIVVSDLHPGYHSTKFGERHFGKRLKKVQHHYAHILSCMAENDMPEDAEVIGMAFDGTGYGTDNTIWGSEVMIASYRGFKRAFHLQPYKLPGGDMAVKEPWRTALSLLYSTFGEKSLDMECMAIPEKEKAFLIEMMKKDINSPLTTSMGRLFDGVAAMIGLNQRVSYHAQAAIALEQLALRSGEGGSYPVVVKSSMIGHMPLIKGIVDDINNSVPKEDIARKFHNTITDIIINAAGSLRGDTGISVVALSGGVFQNALLLESTFGRLQEKGFTVLIHQIVPPNDGGISLGQAVSAIQ
ncbi:carbamoyltransferase HypF [bacterium BMS3Bbin09]|nr:carbamoyltransferase HypF [bacterium BMS3Bbin09]